MLLVAELDLGELELALALDEGLVRAVDHDVADRRVGEQLFERPEAEQLVDQHLLERELLAAVEVDLQLGEHLADDRAEFLGQLVLAERGGRFGIDALEQARKHLFLDPVNRGFEAFGLAAAGFAAGVLARGRGGPSPPMRPRHRRRRRAFDGRRRARRSAGTDRRLVRRRSGGCGAARAPPFIGLATPNCGRPLPPPIPPRLPNALIPFPFLRFPPRIEMVNRSETFRKS